MRGSAASSTYFSPTQLTERIDKVGSQVMGEIEQVCTENLIPIFRFCPVSLLSLTKRKWR
jgi:hypothetical protein